MNTPQRDPFARDVYPDSLRDGEQSWIEERQRHALDGSQPHTAEAVAVGLSGGGIRSATFALGFFQALARRRLVRSIDYLSTVSGGGYFGAFLGALFGRRFIREGSGAVDDVEDALAEKPGSFQVAGHTDLTLRAPARALRENGRYLAPTGGGDLLLAAAGLLRNWIVVQVAVWVSLTGMFLLLRVMTRPLVEKLAPSLQKLPGGAPWASGPGGLGVLAVLALLLLWIAPTGWGYWMADKLRIVVPPGVQDGPLLAELRRRWMRKRIAGPAVVSAVLVVCSILFLVGDPPTGATTALVALGLPAWVLMWVASVAGTPGSREGTPKESEESIAVLAPTGAAVGLLLSTGIATLAGADHAAAWAGVGGVGLTLITLIAVSIAMLRPENTGEPQDGTPVKARPVGRLRWFRNLITRSFKRGLLVAAGLLLLAGVAWASAKLYAVLTAPDPLSAATQAWLGAAASLGVVPAFAKRILLLFAGNKPGRPGLTPTILAGIAAIVVLIVLLVGSDLLARLMLDKGGHAFLTNGWIREHWSLVAVATAGILVFALGRSLRLLNLSSQQNFYSQRLIRAYLGSSNEARLNGNVALAEAVRSDDALPAEYWRNDRGAPLHLINVTVNETFDGKSQVEQRDRKGLSLAVGPCGVSAGTRHHALVDWKQDPPHVGATSPDSGYRVFCPGFSPQTLTIGEWTGISGAAFSTGLGARTNLGMSALCGLANVRLGYWWDARVDRPRVRGLKLRRHLAWWLPLQSYLLNELLAQFPGTSWRHWYLTDGGHFENLAGYELIRRQLKCLVIVDGEQDADYRFEGLGTLVRLARVDFRADIRFLDEAELDRMVAPGWRHWFGSLDHLQRGRWTGTGASGAPQAGRAAARLEAAVPEGHSLAHAAMARIRYPGSGGIGCLLYVKTTLVGDEPIDVAHYHARNAAFPHESTSDQFFDEPQWESYRMLGDHIAWKLFGPPAGLPNQPSPPSPPAATVTWKPADLLRGALPGDFETLP